MKQLLFNILVIIILTAVILAVFPLAGFSMDNMDIGKEVIGKVVALRGKATALQSGSKSRILLLKSPVFQNDTIKTTQGRIQLMFMDNTLITLGQNTEMIIEEYLWKSNDPNSAMKTRIKAGSFRVMGGAITRDAPQNFKTHAPSATIGIRGSMYAGIVKGNSLSVVFQGGKGIYVANTMGSVDIDRPGYGTIVSGMDQAPEKPKKFDEKILKDIEGGLTNSDKDEGKKIDQADKGDIPDGSQDETAGQASNNTSENIIPDTTPQTDTTNSIPGILAESLTDKTEETLEITLITDKASISDKNQDKTDPTDTDPTNTGPTDTDPTDTDPIEPVSDEERTILSMLEDQGFSGERIIALPSSGIGIYKGELKDNFDETINEFVTVYVNWDNKRFFAIEGDSDHPNIVSYGFGFGEIMDSGEIMNVQVLGSGSYNYTQKIETMIGSETFGHFYGINQGAAGIFLEGYDINVQDQTDRTAWSDTLAVLVDSKITNPDSGITDWNDWNGFFIGVGEDMNNPNTDRVIFVNSDSNEFKLPIDKDAGTFFGTMSGKDFLGSATELKSLTLGGSTSESVYVSNDKIAAILGGDNVISNTSGNTNLKDAGNFMVSSMEPQLSNNTNWGYWEIAYEEPGTGKDFHVHVPGSLWIAGEQTLESAMDNLIATSFVATYTGGAQGVKFDDNSQMMGLTNGQTDLTIEFDSASSTPVYGTISFDEISLPITSTMGNVTAKGFKGYISTAATSRINGTYFGNNAQGIGGNFSAIMPDGVNFQGIFAGDR
jgi:hypothetical protein